MNNNNQNSWGDQSQAEKDPWGHQSEEQQNFWGNGDQNPWITSQSMIDNSYMENIWETNFFDNPYTETFTNPNPENEQDSGWEI